MKELNWRHIRNTVTFTVLFWPFFAVAYFVILAVIPWTTSGTLYFTVCFSLSVITPAFIIGGASPDLKKKVLHGFVSTGLALPAAALSAFLFFSTINFYTSPPSDWRLIRRFERNEAAFDELRDAVQREEERESYDATMKRLGISNADKNPESIYFALEKQGFSTTKYYVYQKTLPPSRQMVEKISGGDRYVYRSIGGGWYLYVRASS